MGCRSRLLANHFYVHHLKKIAENLNVEALRRTKRDGSGEISMHDESNLSKSVKSQQMLKIIVIILPSLDENQRKNALKLAADIIFHASDIEQAPWGRT